MLNSHCFKLKHSSNCWMLVHHVWPQTQSLCCEIFTFSRRLLYGWLCQSELPVIPTILSFHQKLEFFNWKKINNREHIWAIAGALFWTALRASCFMPSRLHPFSNYGTQPRGNSIPWLNYFNMKYFLLAQQFALQAFWMEIKCQSKYI